MQTIPVIVAEDESPQEGTLGGGILSPETKGTKVKDLQVSKLRESLTQLSECTSILFQDIRKIGNFQLKEVQLQVEITAEGGFALIGTAKAGAKGAITLTFKES